MATTEDGRRHDCRSCTCKDNIKKQKILVTGAAGFVGGHMLEEMQARGYTDIRATDLFTPKNLPEGIEFIKSDVTDRKSLDDALEGCHGVIHVADLFDFFASWEKLYAVNVEGTINICKAAIDAGAKRMVRFSSGSIYKVGKDRDEYSPLDPIDPYAKSKIFGEAEASKLNGENDFLISLLRPGVIFGKGSKYGFVRIALTQGIAAKYLGTKLLPGEGTFKGPYVHVDDVVGAALHIYERDLFTHSRNPADMAFNINADDAVSPKDIAEMADVNVRKTWLAKLLHGHMPDIHVTRQIMEPIAKASSYAVKSLLNAGILKKKIGLMVEYPGELDFMFVPGDLEMKNAKLKEYGFAPKNRCDETMPGIIRGIDNDGLEKLFF